MASPYDALLEAPSEYDALLATSPYDALLDPLKDESKKNWRTFLGQSPETPKMEPVPARTGDDPNDPHSGTFPEVVFGGPPIPRPFGQQKGTAAQIAAGIGNAPADFARFALSGPGVITAGVLPLLSPAMQRLVAAGFTIDQAKKAVEATNTQDRTEAIVGAALGAVGAVKAPEILGSAKEELPAAKTEPPIVDQEFAPDTRTEGPTIPEMPQREVSPETSVSPVESPYVAATDMTSDMARVAPTETADIPNVPPHLQDMVKALGLRVDNVTPEGIQLTSPAGHSFSFDPSLPPEMLHQFEEANRRSTTGTGPGETQNGSAVLGESNGSTPPYANAAVAGAETSGVANRVFADKAAAGQMGEVEPGNGMSWPELVQMGQQAIKNGTDPLKIAAQFKRDRKVSPNGFAAVRAEQERLSIESNKAADAHNANPTQVSKAFLEAARKAETDWARNVVQPMKTATSDTFRGMQGDSPIDPTTYEGMRRAVVERTGKEPNAIQEATLRRTVKKVRQTVDGEKQVASRLGAEIDKAFPKTRTPSLDELRLEMAKMAEELTPCNI